ncbi:MAG: HNH endonuclease signature motif containing protein [Chloroflexota bacterium]|nr:HNH endonuclease signature motif containing protein [Chloroflexota bacterium]
MVIDHIIPLTRKGETSLSNLSLSCVGCNMFKRDFVAAIDPETGAETTLFNPRIQNWNDTLAGTTRRRDWSVSPRWAGRQCRACG